MKLELRTSNITIDNDSSTFIIGEIGINHNGDVDQAKKLVDIAIEAGCSAVKFQKRVLDSIYTDEVLNNLKDFEQGFQYLIPILKDYEFNDKQILELKAYCDEKEITFICTPFDKESAELVNSMGVEIFKVSSADLTNFHLLDILAGFNKPLILSTGMSTFEQIDQTVNFLKDRKVEFMLLHCVSSYPVNYSDANLKRITKLKDRYGCLVGYSGHDDGVSLSLAAVALGAVLVEKHITLDRSLRGPDHKFSLLPDDLKLLCSEIRKVDQAMLGEKSYLLQGEKLNSMVFRKSVVADCNIEAGEIITREMLTAKSPDNGLSVQRIFELPGAVATRNFKKNDLFFDYDLSDGVETGLRTSLDWAKQGYVVRYHDFETVLDYNPKCLEFHFTYKDTTLSIPHDKFRKYKDKLKNMTLRIHCCEYIGEELFDICNSRIETRLMAQEILQRVVNITSEISGYFADEKPLIVFNCGAMTRHDSPNSIKLDANIIHEHFKKIDMKNTGFIAQNMPPYPWYFGGQWRGHYFLEAQELLKFCEATNESICLDTSHGQMACTYLKQDFTEYAKTLLPFVEHLHISDADGVEGEGTQIGTGDVDFKSFFSAYKDYQGTWIPEIWQGHVNNNYDAKKALEIISTYVKK